MKKTKLIVASLICGGILVGTGMPAFAADNEANTNGTVNFTAGEGTGGGGNVTDPGDNNGGEEGNVTPPGGGSTGALRIQEVSNFDFGTQKISPRDETYDAKVVKFTSTSSSEGTRVAGQEYYMANFLQVADLSGQQAGWNVKVKASPFSEVGATGQAPTLQGTEMRVSGFSEGFATTGATATILPTVDAGKSYKAITDTNSTIYSGAAGVKKSEGIHTLVFGSKNIDAAGTDADSTHSGVQLFVPAVSGAKADKAYESTLTWTISAGPNNAQVNG